VFDDALGRTAFHTACFMGNLNVVQFLLQRGFDMNVGENNGFTGFHGACIGGKVHPFVIEQGFDVPSSLVNDLPEHNVNTRFPLVCLHGNLNVVQFLLQQG
jgi:ankyrin repeat protein